MEQVLLVMTNLPDLATAQTMARTLIGAKLAACVNILPGVHSTYRWQGQIEESHETSLVIKTTKSHYAQVQQAILAGHPYELPEIIAWPLTEGHAPYLHWIIKEIAQDGYA